MNVEKESERYLNEELGVDSIEDAITGAQDIIAEWISDDAGIRKMFDPSPISKG